MSDRRIWVIEFNNDGSWEFADMAYSERQAHDVIDGFESTGSPYEYRVVAYDPVGGNP